MNYSTFFFCFEFIHSQLPEGQGLAGRLNGVPFKTCSEPLQFPFFGRKKSLLDCGVVNSIVPGWGTLGGFFTISTPKKEKKEFGVEGLGFRIWGL